MTDTTTIDAEGGFARRLRMQTRSSHEQAETSPFMTNLFAGDVPLHGYVELLAQQYFLYTVLEGAGAALSEDPMASAFIRDDLLRGPALSADLEHFLGKDWRNRINALPATTDYCDRVAAAAADPATFVAHHYTRYLGDVSGGAMLRDVVRRIYAFDGVDGTRFYEFDLGDITAFRGGYRRLLDETPWSADQRDAMVAEAQAAFECNIAMFNAIGDSLD